MNPFLPRRDADGGESPPQDVEGKEAKPDAGKVRGREIVWRGDRKQAGDPDTRGGDRRPSEREGGRSDRGRDDRGRFLLSTM